MSDIELLGRLRGVGLAVEDEVWLQPLRAAMLRSESSASATAGAPRGKLMLVLLWGSALRLLLFVFCPQ